MNLSASVRDSNLSVRLNVCVCVTEGGSKVCVSFGCVCVCERERECLSFTHLHFCPPVQEVRSCQKVEISKLDSKKF